MSWRTTLIGFLVILAVIGFNAFTLISKGTWSGESILTALAAIGLFFSRDSAVSKKSESELHGKVDLAVTAAGSAVQTAETVQKRVDQAL